MKRSIISVVLLVIVVAVPLLVVPLTHAGEDPCPQGFVFMGWNGEDPICEPEQNNNEPQTSTSSSQTSTSSSQTSEPVQTPAPEPVVNTLPGDVGEFRMNDADLSYAFFRGEDNTGNEALDVYDLQNGTAQGIYLFSVTQEDIAPYLTNLPTENVQLFAQGHISAYVLTTGEVQINVGPDSEGKIYVRIFDGIPWTHVYGYTIDPQNS